MRWSDERWVKVYTRDTADLIAVGWQARAVFWELTRKVDASGRMDTSEPEVVAEIIRMPADVVAPALDRLAGRGCVILSDSGDLLVPSHCESQASRTSPKERTRRHREKQRVTQGNAETRGDTNRGEENRVEERRVERSHSVESPTGASLSPKKKKDPPPTWALDAADDLRDAVLKVWPNEPGAKSWAGSRTKWAATIALMETRAPKVTPGEVADCLIWLAGHLGGDFVPEVRSAKALRAKWGDIQAAIRRSERPVRDVRDENTIRDAWDEAERREALWRSQQASGGGE